MRQDLLAPPVIKPRVLKRVAVGVCVVAAVIGVVIGWVGRASMWEWAGIGVRVGLVLGLAAAWVWAMMRLGRVGAACRAERLPLVHAANSVMGMVFFYLAAMIMLFGAAGRFGGMFTAQIIMFTAITFGGTLMMGGWGRRVGESMHCPQCEYEFGFWDQDDPPVRCPECGTGWLGRLKKGRKVRSGRMMATGAAIMVLGLVVSSPVFYIHRIVPYMPTMALYAMVYVSPVGNDAAWKEMQTRPLSDEWARRLEQRVLGDRAEWSFHDGGGRWMETRLAAGSVDNAARERFFGEGFVAELVVPRSVHVGEEFPIAIRVTRAADAGSLHLAVMFEGYRVGSGTVWGRESEEQWGYRLRPDSFSMHKDVFRQHARAEGVRSGETLRVEAVYWVAYQGAFSRIVWEGEGASRRPKNSVWFRRVVVEREVRVE